MDSILKWRHSTDTVQDKPSVTFLCLNSVCREVIENPVRREKRWRFDETRRRRKTTPLPIDGVIDEPTAHWIEDIVSSNLKEIWLTFNHKRLESTLKQMPDGPMNAIKRL